MMKRFSVCAALFAAILVAQPALAAVKLVGSSGNSGSSNPEDWTMAVVSPDDENLYEVSIADGSATYIRGLRNDVDQQLIDDYGWIEPVWGESYRDGQSIAYNPNDKLLWHRNGTTGYRDPLLHPAHYDTRLIETYVPGGAADFSADPVNVYNSLAQALGGPTGRVDPDHPIDGTIWDESRSFSYDAVNDNFILANNNGNIGIWDPTDLSANSAIHVQSNAQTSKGLVWYDDGSATGRVFVGVNSESPGDIFYELDSNIANIATTYLAPLEAAAIITLSGGPIGGLVDQTIGMAQNPETDDLYAIVTMSTGGRALIVYDAADIAAFDATTDVVIDATFLGATSGIQITSIAFVPLAPSGHQGDFNESGGVPAVDGIDYLTWASAFGSPLGLPNDDGIPLVDGLDYLLWASHFGHSGPPDASAVPEPGTFALAGLALVGLLVSRRRRS